MPINRTIYSVLTIKDLIKDWTIPSASIVYRREFLEITPWLKDIYHGDYAMGLILASKGKIKYVNETMAVYRRTMNTHSCTSKFNAISHYYNLIKLLGFFDKYTDSAYSKEIRVRIFKIKIQRLILSQKVKYPRQWYFIKKIKELTIN